MPRALSSVTQPPLAHPSPLPPLRFRHLFQRPPCPIFSPAGIVAGGKHAWDVLKAADSGRHVMESPIKYKPVDFFQHTTTYGHRL